MEYSVAEKLEMSRVILLTRGVNKYKCASLLLHWRHMFSRSLRLLGGSSVLTGSDLGFFGWRFCGLVHGVGSEGWWFRFHGRCFVLMDNGFVVMDGV